MKRGIDECLKCRSSLLNKTLSDLMVLIRDSFLDLSPQVFVAFETLIKKLEELGMMKDSQDFNWYSGETLVLNKEKILDALYDFKKNIDVL